MLIYKFYLGRQCVLVNEMLNRFFFHHRGIQVDCVDFFSGKLMEFYFKFAETINNGRLSTCCRTCLDWKISISRRWTEIFRTFIEGKSVRSHQGSYRSHTCRMLSRQIYNFASVCTVLTAVFHLCSNCIRTTQMWGEFLSSLSVSRFNGYTNELQLIF